MTEQRAPGRSLITPRALSDIIRPAVTGIYGVMGFVDGTRAGRLGAMLGLADRGIRISLDGGIAVDLHLAVAYGLPVAEVARQADSAVRYAIRRALGVEIDRLTIHVGGMRHESDGLPTQVATSSGKAATDATDEVASINGDGAAAARGGSDPA
jgi:uncharacterized alkaline shock family protein YloU